MKNSPRHTVSGIAKEIGVTRQTIYYWIKKGWVVPRRDYRNYPVFSDKDLAAIKKWHGALRVGNPPVKQTNIKVPASKDIPPKTSLTWEQILKTFYK